MYAFNAKYLLTVALDGLFFVLINFLDLCGTGNCMKKNCRSQWWSGRAGQSWHQSCRNCCCVNFIVPLRVPKRITWRRRVIRVLHFRTIGWWQNYEWYLILFGIFQSFRRNLPRHSQFTVEHTINYFPMSVSQIFQQRYSLQFTS